MTPIATNPQLQRIVEAVRARRRFVVTSHARPDGDAIGSSLAMAYALRQLGKDVRVISRDAPPPPLLVFPGVPEIEVVRYAIDLRSLSHGTGTFSRTYLRHEPMPQHVAQKVLADNKSD